MESAGELKIESGLGPVARSGRSAWVSPQAAITLLAFILFALRLAAPENLLDQDQERPATYVLDVLKNGNWLCQRDLTGDITSKPPLYTWLCAMISLPTGRVTLFAMYLPGALAAWGAAMLVFGVGRNYFGVRSAFFASVACLLTTAGLKAFGLARTDSLFAFTVVAAALIAFHSWQRGSGWHWFWLAAAASTLTKGPLGLLLAAGGLLAAFWEGKSGKPLPIRGSQLAGVVIFLLLAGGWFLLAWMQEGQPFIDKILGKELFGHVAVKGRRIPGSLFYQPSLYYLGRAAPWSFFAIYSFWRLWKYPAANDAERRFERFLFCWFFLGLLIFSVPTHQRADLLWPIMPAGALLAGREVNRLSQWLGAKTFDRWFAALVAVAIGLFGFYYFGPHARQPVIARTIALKTLARQIEQTRGKDFPLIHTDDPMALRIYLNTWRPRVSFEQAAESLRQPASVHIAVHDLAKLQKARRPDDPPIYIVLPKADDPGRKQTRIVSNQPGF